MLFLVDFDWLDFHSFYTYICGKFFKLQKGFSDCSLINNDLCDLKKDLYKLIYINLIVRVCSGLQILPMFSKSPFLN